MSVKTPILQNQGFNDVINNSDWNGSLFRQTITIVVPGLYRIVGAYLKSAGTAFGVALNGAINTSPRLLYITSSTVPGSIDFYFAEGDIVYIEIIGVASGSSDQCRYSITRIS